MAIPGRDGRNYISADLYVKEAHRRDVKFNHFITHGESASVSQTVNSGEQVQVQLQTATGPDAAYTIVCDALVIHFKRMLRMTEDQKVDESVGLVDQGVDSLVAVDIRAWFLKEVNVDVPTLKIMGGASIADLVRIAVDNMPQFQDIGDVESPVEVTRKGMPSSLSSKPEEAHTQPRSARAPTISTPLSSGSPIFTPAEVTTPSTSGVDSGRTSPPTRLFRQGFYSDG